MKCQKPPYLIINVEMMMHNRDWLLLTFVEGIVITGVYLSNVIKERNGIFVIFFANDEKIAIQLVRKLTSDAI